MELKHELIPSWGLSGQTSGKSCSPRCPWCLYKVLRPGRTVLFSGLLRIPKKKPAFWSNLSSVCSLDLIATRTLNKKKLQISSVNDIFQCSVGFHICGALMTYDTVSATAGTSEQKLKIPNPRVAWSYWIFWIQYVWNRCTTSLWLLTDINGFPSQFSNDGLLSFIKGH